MIPPFLYGTKIDNQNLFFIQDKYIHIIRNDR